jgi:hypothetical protein
MEIVIYQKFPQLESLSRALAEAVMTKYQHTFAEFKMASRKRDI